MNKHAPTRVVAVPWYHDPISYRSARHLMVDKDRLPVNFARWLEAASHYVQRLQAQGYVVEKVMIVPSQFREWALRTGHDHDATAGLDSPPLCSTGSGLRGRFDERPSVRPAYKLSPESKLTLVAFGVLMEYPRPIRIDLRSDLD